MPKSLLKMEELGNDISLYYKKIQEIHEQCSAFFNREGSKDLEMCVPSTVDTD